MHTPSLAPSPTPSLTITHSHISCQEFLARWSLRWEFLAKGYCLLDVRDTPDFFKYSQPVGFNRKYGATVACELDGTLTKHDKSRRHSVKARCSYADKWCSYTHSHTHTLPLHSCMLARTSPLQQAPGRPRVDVDHCDWSGFDVYNHVVWAH